MKVYIVLEEIEYENHISKVFLNEKDATRYEMLIDNSGGSSWVQEYEVEEKLEIDTIKLLRIYAHKNLNAEAYTFELEVVECPVPTTKHDVDCTIMTGSSGFGTPQWGDTSKQIRMEVSRVIDTELNIEKTESIYRKEIEDILFKVENQTEHYFNKPSDQQVTEFEEKLKNIVL